MRPNMHPNRPQTANGRSKSTFLWIKPDRGPHVRWVAGSVTISVPERLHDVVLSTEFEEWCLDNIEQGVLAEWVGMELFVHFVSKTDRILTQLRWF